MNNNLTFKFDFQTENQDCAYSLLAVVMDSIKSIQSKCAGLKYVEVNLFKPDDQEEDQKTALFRLVSDDSTITEYSRSKHWEDALLNAFDKVKERFAA